jgi:hypothetical protein
MDKIKELLANGEFEARLDGCIDAGRVKALAKECGTDLTDEEAQEAVSFLKVRLSDDDLEKVAGGVEKAGNWMPAHGLKTCPRCGVKFLYTGGVFLCPDCIAQTIHVD